MYISKTYTISIHSSTAPVNTIETTMPNVLFMWINDKITVEPPEAIRIVTDCLSYMSTPNINVPDVYKMNMALMVADMAVRVGTA